MKLSSQDIRICPITKKQLKRCSNCNAVKPVIFFSLDSTLSSGFQSWCKKCKSSNSKGIHRKYREAEGFSSRNSKAENRPKAVKRDMLVGILANSNYPMTVDQIYAKSGTGQTKKQMNQTLREATKLRLIKKIGKTYASITAPP